MGRKEELRMLLDSGVISHVRRGELMRASSIWAYGIVTPCTIVSVAEFSRRGNIKKAAVGHFSPNEVEIALPDMLEGYNPQRSYLLMAGMGRRSSVEILRECCEFLEQRINDWGLPCALGWQLEDWPQFLDIRDPNDVRVISDIGRGVGQEDLYPRHIYVGMTEREMMMFSQRIVVGRGDQSPVEVLTRDQGRIKITPSQFLPEEIR